MHYMVSLRYTMRTLRRLPRASFVRISGLMLALAGMQAGLQASAAEHDHPPPVVLAPGYSDLEFNPPEPGTYALPPMGEAADGDVINQHARDGRLHDYLGDKLVVMSFIFTTCSDINGCPLATFVFKGVQDRLREDPALARQVRLLSFSFDPEHDKPQVLDAYAGHFRHPQFDWQFLTTKSTEALTPILADYGQWVIRDYDEDGNYLGSMSHVLRVFLIDRDKRIRNIYSTSFLHADTVANDLRTLLMESDDKTL